MINKHLFELVLNEHARAQEKHGAQDYPNGTGNDASIWVILNQVRDLVSLKTDMKVVTWAEVLFEECLEAMEEKEPDKLKAELIQVASVALAWATKLESEKQ